MLPVLLLSCTPSSTLALNRPLDGSPTGLALTPDRQLVITHTTPAGGHRLAVHDRSTGTLLWSHGAGPGGPVVGEERIYTLTEEGVQAFRDGAVDWSLPVDGLLPADSAIALTQEEVVVFATQTGADGVLNGVTHLGYPLWQAPIQGAPRGAPVVDGANVVYTWAFDGDEAGHLHAVDGDDGTVIWSLPGLLQPLLALDEGLLASDGDRVHRIAPDGAIAWSVDSTAESATRAGDAVLLPGADGTKRIALQTGVPTALLPPTCGPITIDLLSNGWAMCNHAAGNGVELTTLSLTALSADLPIGEAVPVDAPLLVDGTAFVVVDGIQPRLLGFRVAASAADGPWPRANGGTGNDRRTH